MEKYEMISYEEFERRYYANDLSLISDPIFGKYFIIEDSNDNKYITFRDRLQLYKYLEDIYNHVLQLQKIELWKNMK
jgi:hypothetical protein